MTTPLRIVCLCLLSGLAASACDEDVLTFPTLEPARIRIVNTAIGTPFLQFVIDSTIVIDVPYSDVSTSTNIPAGRPIPFVINVNGRPAGRDTSRYTFGTSGASFLVSTSTTPGNYTIVSPIRDTILPAGVPNGYIKFLHAVNPELADRSFEVEVILNTDTRLFGTRTFEPYVSSPNFAQLAPGTYSFRIQEAGGTTVFARLDNVIIEAGKSYLLYSFLSQPATADGIALKIQ
jgi:hypothetical protein